MARSPSPRRYHHSHHSQHSHHQYDHHHHHHHDIGFSDTVSNVVEIVKHEHSHSRRHPHIRGKLLWQIIIEIWNSSGGNQSLILILYNEATLTDWRTHLYKYLDTFQYHIHMNDILKLKLSISTFLEMSQKLQIMYFCFSRWRQFKMLAVFPYSTLSLFWTLAFKLFVLS